MLNNIRFENTDALLFCGDIHGEFETIVYKLNQYNNAVLIVCGDIGMGFHKDEMNTNDNVTDVLHTQYQYHICTMKA
ncbi:hypothetical protein LJC12_02900 [Odoribacter sp. OttesenSCG-928-J03]|nr:hypothetical protein [Odoribacter sp. OttesenSCG-928-J03]